MHQNQLQYGEAYKVWRQLGNWLNLGGNQWIYYDSSYIRYAGESSSVEGKRVVSKVEDLRFYSKPSWADRDVAEYVGEGVGFQIIDKVSVNGSQQYKSKNSRGNVFYITASSYYVEVR